MNNNGQELNDLIQSNQLPFYACVKNDQTSNLIYLYDAFEADCLFAKCYNNSRPVVNYLLHHRPSYAGSESNFTTSLAQTRSTFAEFMFSDIVNIPYHYHGLFELFSSNSIKFGGILDHERDLISLADHITTPKNYYVAKEMKVYELFLEKSLSFSLFHKLLNKTSCAKKFQHRKWTKFKQGTICKAIRVVMVDYDSEETSWSFLNKLAWCCNSSSNKRSDMAIEFKIIENFDELITNDGVEQQSDARKIYLSKKSFYLPINESTLNNDIDLIPISQMVKRLSLNNLQTINNLIFNDELINNRLELKLFDENPFVNRKNQPLKKSKSTQNLKDLLNMDYLKSNNKSSEFLKFNQHLELDKYLSIFELTQLKLKTKIIIGFNIATEQLFFLPVEQINSDFKLCKNTFFKINHSDEMSNEGISNFKSKTLEYFKNIAQVETQKFSLNLNKIETFCTFNRDTFKKTNKLTKQKHSIVNHFADFIHMDAESNHCFNFNTSTISTFSNNMINFEKAKAEKPTQTEILNVQKLIDLNIKLRYKSLPNRKCLKILNNYSEITNFQEIDNNKIFHKNNSCRRIWTSTLPAKKLVEGQISNI